MLGEQMLMTAWDILNSPDWILERQLENGDQVQVKQVKGKKVFKLSVSTLIYKFPIDIVLNFRAM